MSLLREIQECRLCAERFAATHSVHTPRPVAWFDPEATPQVLIAGQAPGARVHESGKPFTDPSGDRLRSWLDLEETVFYDRSRVAIVPMAFCFPGYSPKGSDLPPPAICARTWRARVMHAVGAPRLTVVVGAYAMRWHLQSKASVGEIVRNWRDGAVGRGPRVFPLPHPSWRNTGWLKRNPWFEAEVLPALRKSVKEALQ